MLQNGINKPLLFLLSTIAMAALLLPALLGESAYILIHDNLDAYFVWYKLLLNSPECEVCSAVSETPKASLGIKYGIDLLIVQICGNLWGYLLNDIVIRVVAFFGMYFLTEKYIFREEKSKIIPIIIGVSYALIPFYSLYCLSTAGQPLLIYSLLNFLNRRQRKLDYFVLLLTPFYSSLVLNWSIFIVFGIIVFYSFTHKNTSTKNVIIATSIFFVLSILANLQLIEATFGNSNFVSHREEFNSFVFHDTSLSGAIHSTISYLKETQYHTGKFSTLLIVFTFGISVVLQIIRKSYSKLQWFIAASIFAIALYCGFYYYFANKWNLHELVPFLNKFQATRLYFILPILWFVLFALSIKTIITQKKTMIIALLLVAGQMFMSARNNTELKINTRQLLAKALQKPSLIEHLPPNYEQFFAQDLFQEIEDYIQIPQKDYRVVCLGFFPEIALYNGFYTLDCYSSNYSIEYKHVFRKIIAKELEKSAHLKNQFDNWGSRCYVFSSELGYNFMYGKNENKTVEKLEINTQQIKLMGGNYIISSVEIANHKELGLTLEKTFNNPNSFWQVRLYKIL